MAPTREFDLIIFGATGFTGQYVAEEVARITDEENVTWAVAGRSVEKMKTILQNVEKATGIHHIAICVSVILPTLLELQTNHCLS